jgi:HAD superfamily hydrolase (TIGR01484 family)
MELPIKIISTDFDGTVHSDGEHPRVPLSLQNRIAELQERGVKWVVNTGRDFNSLVAALDSARLKVAPDYLVVVEREIHVRDGQGYDACLAWNERCRSDQAILFAKVEPRLEAVVDWINERYQAVIYADDYSPFCLAAATNGDADGILRHVGEAFRDMPELSIVRNDVYARFSHAAYNKGTAMSEVARLNQVSRNHILAAGDHYNDLPMLSLDHARYLVAPANAISEVKAWVSRQGGYVSLDPYGHGVVQGLDHFLDQTTAKVAI